LVSLPLLIASGCAGKARPVAPLRSAETRPVWIGQVPQPDEEFLYFRGIRTGAGRLEDGEHDAVQAAVRQIIEYLGQEGIAYYAKERDELRTRIIDRVKFESTGRVVGARLLELYFEKNPGAAADGTYDVFVLVRYPHKELERERRRYEDQVKAFFIAAGKRYQQGMQYWNQGRREAALPYLEEARGFLDKIPARRYSPLLADFGGRDIRIEIDRLTSTVRGGAATQDEPSEIKVDYPMMGQSLEALRTKNDFTIFRASSPSDSETKAGYRIAVELGYSNGDRDPGRFFSTGATCRVKLIEVGSDRIVYQFTQESVGFGEDAQRAAVDAMEKCIEKGVKKMGMLLELWSIASR
jgi:hypothetical protein